MNFSDSITALPAQITLANGLRVFFRKTAPSGLASVQVWVKTGSVHEENFLGGGISHFVEHMVFKGTEKFSGEEISRRVQSAGGYINAYTSFERTVYHVDVPAEKTEIAFDVLAQLALYPKLDDADAVSERDVILREIDMGADEPDRRLSEAAFATAYRVHPYRIPVIGHRDVFCSLNANDLREYFARRYTTETIHLVVAGDIARENVFALAEKYFGSARRKPCPAPLVPEEPPQLARRETALHGDVNILRGSAFWKIPGLAHEDALPLGVLAGILGNGDSALLYRELHEELELVHEIDASAWTPGGQGLFSVSYIADCGKQKVIEDALQKIIAKIAREGVSEKLIKKVARQSIVSLVNSRKTVSRTAARLGAETVVLGDPGATKIFIERISALTPDDIRRVAGKYFRDDGLTVATFDKTPAKSASAQKPISPAPGNVSSSRESSETLPPAREDFEQFTLANGVRILMQRENALPKIHIRAMMLAGGAFEKMRARGASSLLSTLLTMDTQTRSAAEVAEIVESAGGVFDDVAGTNSLALSVETLPEDAPLACEILCDAVLRPKFSQKNFRTERDSQLAALNADMDEIAVFAREKLLEKFFGAGHFLSMNNYGSAETLATMTLAEVCELREKIVVPQNLVIAVSGDFDRDALLDDLTRSFGAFQSAENFPKLSPGNELAETSSRGRGEPIFIERKAEQAIVQLAFPCVGFADERTIVADVLNEIFSGMASRLFSEVREKRGLAYFVSSSRAGTPRDGIFYLYAGTKRENAEKVLAEMRKEIARVRDGGISPEELAGAKTRLVVARRSAMQSPAARAEDAGLNALYGLPINRGNEIEARTNALTADDLALFANEFFRDDSELALIVGAKE